jgi:hypothetical protein
MPIFKNHKYKNRFKNKKVDIKRYIKDYYVENNLAYISVNVNSYEDIISKYSVVGYEDLNQEFVDYIEENAEYIPLEYPIVLEITGTRFSKERQKTIIEAISDYYNMKLGETQEELSSNSRFSLLLLVLAVISVLLYLRVSMTQFFSTALELGIWFFVWTFADVFWLERNEIKERKTDYAQLSSMKVIFKEEFVDDDITEKEEKQIIQDIISYSESE